MVDNGNDAKVNGQAESHNQLGDSGVGSASAPDGVTETTSIQLPPVSTEPAPEHKLGADERAAVEALPAGSALLIAHSGANWGSRFLLDADLTTGGRHPDADIFLDDVTVSRRHVEFRRVAGGFEVVDTGSLNGTYVNGDRVDSHSLSSGNEVQIGKFRFTYYFSPAAATSANS